MNRLRVAPLAALVLVLAAAVLLSGALPASGQTPPILDTFNRMDEDPLSGGGNWARASLSTWFDARLVGNKATHSASGMGMSYWTQDSYPGGAGSVWATYGNLYQAGGNRASVLLLKDVGGSGSIDGYEFTREVFGAAQNCGWLLYRMDNGVRQTGGGGTAPALAGVSNVPQCDHEYINLRRVGNTVEGWTSPDGVNWTMLLTATDSTHSSGTFYPAIVMNTAGAWIDDFGAAPSGGPEPATLTVTKMVVTDNGGSAVPSNWTMNVAGPTPLSFPGAGSPGTSEHRPAGLIRGDRVGWPGRLHAHVLGRL